MPLENNYYYTVRKTREQSYVRDIYYKVSDSYTVVLNLIIAIVRNEILLKDYVLICMKVF